MNESRKMTAQQKASVEKMKRKLQMGMKGCHKFGGEYSTITKPVEFTQNSDGTISYRVVGERKIEKIEFTVLGMQDIPARIRTVVSTGKIMKDGCILSTSIKTTGTREVEQ